jgi:ribonuclease HI
MVIIFYGSVCSKGHGVGCLILSPNKEDYELAVRLEFAYINNQAEYEALLCGLEAMRDMGIKNVDAFGDSKLVVQQMSGESQCLDGVLNRYNDACLDIIRSLDDFCITHVPRHKNKVVNILAQQASGYDISIGRFISKRRPAIWDVVLPVEESAKENGSTRWVEVADRPTSSRQNCESVGKEDMAGVLGSRMKRAITLSGHRQEHRLRMVVSGRAGNDPW